MTFIGLPRLLYIGDVPIEASYHGSALLFRLLENYPSNRLRIVEAGIQASRPERRIAEVEYRVSLLPWKWLRRAGLARYYRVVALWLAERRAADLRSTFEDFAPEAVLTTAHGFSWITAAEIARRLSVPLHLVCHDEWVQRGMLYSWRNDTFGKYFRNAASRLCVSPFMVEEYARRYGVLGEVLYPYRAKASVAYTSPPSQVETNDHPLTVIFAGTGAPVTALNMVAASLLPIGGRVRIYGPLTPRIALASGLAERNIEIAGLLPSSELIARMRSEADILYVPMSFAHTDRSTMELGFPSKLTDYTAVGVPLLIHGPTYCSAVRWALDNEGVAEVVTDESPAAIGRAITKLARMPSHRVALSRRAIEVGAKYFHYEAAEERFLSAIKRGRLTGYAA